MNDKEFEQAWSFYAQLCKEKNLAPLDIEKMSEEDFWTLDKSLADRFNAPISELLEYYLAKNGGEPISFIAEDQDLEDFKKIYSFIESELKKKGIKFAFYDEFYGQREIIVFLYKKSDLPIFVKTLHLMEMKLEIKKNFSVLLNFMDEQHNIIGKDNFYTIKANGKNYIS